jgi:predicted NUDIX family NTP pyrophosphohydrolase
VAKASAGVLAYRRKGRGVEFFLVHPGGPFWAKKDHGAWTIPKGEYEANEDAEAAARREFEEETGVALDGAMNKLGAFRQPSGKTVQAWAIERDIDTAAIRSNDFELEWPPKSGKRARFPEVDRAGWFAPAEALVKIINGQRPIVTALCRELGVNLAAG